MNKRYAFLAFSSWTLAACSMDASIVSTALPSSVLTANRVSPDFVAGEVVMTNAGFEVRGAFGEIPDSALMGNGLQIQGVVK